MCRQLRGSRRAPGTGLPRPCHPTVTVTSHPCGFCRGTEPTGRVKHEIYNEGLTHAVLEAEKSHHLAFGSYSQDGRGSGSALCEGPRPRGTEGQEGMGALFKLRANSLPLASGFCSAPRGCGLPTLGRASPLLSPDPLGRSPGATLTHPETRLGQLHGHP